MRRYLFVLNYRQTQGRTLVPKSKQLPTFARMSHCVDLLLYFAAVLRMRPPVRIAI